MFGLFRPTCPIDVYEKAWLEQRLAWLTRTFGGDYLREGLVVLPDRQHFPDPYTGDLDSARVLFDRLCTYTEVEPGRVRLELFDPERHDGLGYSVAGGRERIAVLEEQLKDTRVLVGVLAHQLSYVQLLGDGRISPEVADLDLVADLLTVFGGLGVLGANNPLRETTATQANLYPVHLRRVVYLPDRVFGYALALFAFAREEAAPAWAKQLHSPNIRSVFHEGLKYLAKTKDTTFDGTESLDDEDILNQSLRQAREDLASDVPTEKILGLWAVRYHAAHSPGDAAAANAAAAAATDEVAELVEAVRLCLSDKDNVVRREAADTLRALGMRATPALESLITAARGDTDNAVRRSALAALKLLKPDPEVLLPQLIHLLDDDDATIRAAMADLCGELGPTEEALEKLVLLLRDADFNVTDNVINALARTRHANVVVPRILELLDEDDKSTAPGLLSALGRLGVGSPEVLDALRAALRMPLHPEARDRAAWACHELGQAAAAAIPELERLTLNANPSLRVTASLALIRLEPSRLPGLLPIIARGFSLAQKEPPAPTRFDRPDERDATDLLVSRVGGMLRERGRECLPHLRALLDDGDRGNRLFAIWASGELAADATDLLGPLEVLMHDPHRPIAFSACVALHRIAPHRAEALDAMAWVFRRELETPADEAGDRLRRYMALTMREIGEPTVGPILGMLRDAPAEVAVPAVGLLALIASRAPQIVSQLSDAVGSLASDEGRERLNRLIERIKQQEATEPRLLAFRRLSVPPPFEVVEPSEETAKPLARWSALLVVAPAEATAAAEAEPEDEAEPDQPAPAATQSGV